MGITGSDLASCNYTPAPRTPLVLPSSKSLMEINLHLHYAARPDAYDSVLCYFNHFLHLCFSDNTVTVDRFQVHTLFPAIFCLVLTLFCEGQALQHSKCRHYLRHERSI